MKSDLPILISDLDGTYVNILDVLLDRLWNAFHIAINPERSIRQYDVTAALWESSPETKSLFANCSALDHFLHVMIWNNPSTYAMARPYWDWHAALWRFSKRGGEIIFLTSRPPTPGIVRATEDWLAEMGHEDCELKFSQAYAGGKAEAVQEIIDDNGRREAWLVDDDTSLNDTCKGKKGLRLLIAYRPWTMGGLLQEKPEEALMELLKE